MSEINQNSGEDSLNLPGDYTLQKGEVAFPNSAILLPENISGIQVTLQQKDFKTGVMTITIPVEFLKVEGDSLESGEIGLKLGEDISSKLRGEYSRISIVQDPVFKSFVEVSVPIVAFKKDSGN